jgi:hypothetical protein
VAAIEVRECSNSRQGRIGLVLAGALLATLAFSGIAGAATVNVKSTLDAPDPTPADSSCDTRPTSPGHGQCTLRAAVDTANNHPGDTVRIPAGHYVLKRDRLDLNVDMNVRGASARTTIIDGDHMNNLFFVSSGSVTASISGLALTGGEDFPRGGAIYDYGMLTITRTAIRGNVASDQGGGIFNNGGTVVVKRSTISGNSAATGAGINNGNAGAPSLGTMRVVNSTIANNVASTAGGGLADVGDGGTTLLNDTITGNRAPLRGGLYTASDGAPFRIKNTIVAGNRTGGVARSCTFDGGAILDGGHNLESQNTCGFALGSDKRNRDPRLLALGYYGGPTKTRALRSDSPALDAGGGAGCPATDQRGIHRPQGPRCDIGAVERGA